MFDVTRATTAAATHLGQQRHGHRLTESGIKQQRQSGGQLFLRQAFEAGVEVSQHAANAISNFNIQQFRQATVLCLLDNSLPMELLARPSFREMINFANPEAEAELWVSPRSVATYAMRLFRHIQPQVVQALSEAATAV